jgi:hypothetical protein
MDQNWSPDKSDFPVHVFGVPCEMDPILALARIFLDVIEDSCEALGAGGGRRAGTPAMPPRLLYPNKQSPPAKGE